MASLVAGMEGGGVMSVRVVQLVIALSCLGKGLAAQGAPANGYDSLFDQLMALPGTAGPGIPVSGFTLQRDAATFTLQSGRVSFLGAVGGRRIAAVFSGEGKLDFTPPTSVEREQLKRVLHADTLQRRFTTLFLLFADSTAEDLDRAGAAAGGGSPDAESIARGALGYLANRGRRYFDPHLLTALLNGEHNESFVAVVGGVDGGPFLVRIDPYAVEEVILSMAKSGLSMEDDRSVVVSQFHRARAYRAGRPPSYVAKDRFTVNRYVIDASVGRDWKFRAAATLHTDWLGPTQDWFYFLLFPELKVDSAAWEGGEKAVFARGKDNSVLWVRRPPSAAGPGLPALTVHYHGDLFAITPLWSELKTSNGWYPATGVGYGAPVTAVFDLTFHTPTGFAFASIGDRVQIDSAAGVVTSHWVTKEPAMHASFNVGTFDVFNVNDQRNLPVTVFVNQEAHNHLGALRLRDQNGQVHGGVQQAHMKETVAQDVALSLNFFRDAYGEPVARRFYATEIFGFHGQSFPGLIHFSFLTYQGFLLEKGEDEAFRAHEMAHQWWGLGVVPQSYRDAWLSEGFAEFSGWWYTEAILRDSVALGRIIRKSKDALMARRHLQGPIWLGTRLAEGSQPQDYQAVVYGKGAWVLRMLRNMMFDPDSGEAPFRRMMKDFYESFRGISTSTADFQEMVSRHFRAPMDWFFDSWVYGTGIPTYEWAQTTDEAGGKFVWKLHVTQKDVDDKFTMLVPVHFFFPDGQDGTVRVLVKGPSTDFSAELTGKPARVVFNESDAVLAEVKEVKWR